MLVQTRDGGTTRPPLSDSRCVSQSSGPQPSGDAAVIIAPHRKTLSLTTPSLLSRGTGGLFRAKRTRGPAPERAWWRSSLNGQRENASCWESFQPFLAANSVKCPSLRKERERLGHAL